MNLAACERVLILGDAACAFSGMPVERSDNTGTAMLFEPFLLEQKGRVQQPPKMRKTVAGPRYSIVGAKSTSSE